MIQEVKVQCEVYSRIVGYLRPKRNWNLGKLQELKDRKTYSMKQAIERMDNESTLDK